MSRLGKKEITIPEKTEVSVVGNRLTVKGPLGELSRSIRDEIAISVADGKVSIKPAVETLEAMALWGTYASHLRNMISGVNTLFQKRLALEGIGYKVEVKGTNVNLALGFSLPVEVPIPQGHTVTTEKNVIIVSGIDKEAVGEFAARLRALKKPEPYKGKGIRYEGEYVAIKQGKKSV